MGPGISDNYEDIQPRFTIGYWKVHSARRKGCDERVCLWLMEQEIAFKNKPLTRADKERLGKVYLDSLQRLRKIRHPHVLSIHEVSDSPKNVGFSSEVIDGCLDSLGQLTNDELVYVGHQMAETMKFIHEEVHLSVMSLSVKAFCVCTGLSIKLFDLTGGTPFESLETPFTPTLGLWSGKVWEPSISFCSPEYCGTRQTTAAGDVFSYAAVLGSLKEGKEMFNGDSANEIQNQALRFIQLLPFHVFDEFDVLIQQCIQIDPRKRPTFSQIVESPAYAGVSNRVFKYLDNIMIKDPGDKFNFFKGLQTTLSSFSKRVQDEKFLPLFLSEIAHDIRYGPVLVPMIVEVGDSYTQEQFMRDIVLPLRPYMELVKPPEVSLAFFDCIEKLIEKIPQENRYTFVSPIYNAALGSATAQLQHKAIEKMPVLINSIQSNVVLDELVPRLMDFFEMVGDSCVTAACVRCLKIACANTDPDRLAESTVPRLGETWRKCKNVELGEVLSEYLGALNVSSTTMCESVGPFAFRILTERNLSPEATDCLCTVIESGIANIRGDRRISKGVPKTPIKRITEQRNPIRPAKKEEAFSFGEPTSEVSDADVEEEENQEDFVEKMIADLSKPKSVQPPSQTPGQQKKATGAVARPPPKTVPSLFSGLSVVSTTRPH